MVARVHASADVNMEHVMHDVIHYEGAITSHDGLELLVNSLTVIMMTIVSHDVCLIFMICFVAFE